jgi:hypothetical protein
MFCANCGTANPDAAKFCHKCGSNLVAFADAAPAESVAASQGTVRGASGASPVVRHASNRNPSVALFLSLFITSAGQFYNGDAKKGAVMLVGCIVAFSLIAKIGFIGLFAVWIWSMYDAYQLAKGNSALW